MTAFDFDRFRATPLTRDPFDHMVVPGFLTPRGLDAARRDFPPLPRAGLVREGLRLSLVGRDLLEDHHSEFGDTALWPASEVERGVYGKLEWSW